MVAANRYFRETLSEPPPERAVSVLRETAGTVEGTGVVRPQGICTDAAPCTGYSRTIEEKAMNSNKGRIASIVLLAWLMLVMIFMIMLETVNLEIFFVLWLFGLLLILKLIETPFSEPPHMQRLKKVVVVGIFIFSILMVKKVMEILGS